VKYGHSCALPAQADSLDVATKERPKEMCHP
jgi:hypothetical protein